ncbi:HlyD family efflux transporter periplasmic adaptor subunit [Pseudomonas sp. FW300-N2F2]|uniref:HlyD family efflux transporter periplasmic adaptor subunit n=1 Tax=Pseudomonas sp. FW300-N2F2 TaxID=2751320 RepID=UPI001A916958|nr:HlyD family efflux transporter periplasmic adaptor subunit [Pseudomonas sp. FW300-N2F2]
MQAPTLALTPPAESPVTALPQLRRDLRLHPGPSHRDGSPSWTLEDPARGQFFRLGWAEVEMLKQWHRGNAQAVADAVSRDSTLDLDVEDVRHFSGFLHNLQLIDVRGPQDIARIERLADGRKIGWGRWLLKNYLFIRLPLLRPDRFLEWALPWASRLFSRGFLLTTLAAGLLGLMLVARQWDTFTHTFLHFFSLEGASLAALTLFLTKVLHELGHAFACKYFGCKVATMGVALLVMWPVLYTDTTGAWRLTSRRQRLLIGGAGILTELALAAWATLLWSFLPDGMLRSAAFMLATTTWILTLAVNLSPFMRFDGYFLLSDLLQVPNLQQRAFALARWRLREALFGFKDQPEEVFEPWLQRTLLVYAFGTWIYRLFLFLGIALLVYHFAFKLLGLLLFAVEIGVFVVRPIAQEFKTWVHRRKDYRMNRHTLRSLALVALLVLLVAVPWRASIHAPALLRAQQQAGLFVPVNAQVRGSVPEVGQTVAAGQSLLELHAPQLEHDLHSLERRIATLQWQSSFQGHERETAAHLPVVRHELSVARQRLAVLRQQQVQLKIVAPFSGKLIDIASPLVEGQWLPAGEWLATVTGPQGVQVEAFVSEQELTRLTLGATAWFYPEDLSLPAVALTLDDIAQTAQRTLSAAPELASDYQGGIAARLDADRVAVPEQAIYRLLLSAEGASPPLVLRGTVRIEGSARSPLLQAWRNVLAILIRESAF